MSDTTHSCHIPLALPPDATLTTAQCSKRFKALSTDKEQSAANRRLSLVPFQLSKCISKAIDMRGPVRLAAVALCSLLLLGCREPTIGLSIVGYNHTTDRSLYYFTVNGNMGSSLSPETGGGAFGCCATLPEKWHPGIKVRVVWHYDYGTAIPVPPSSQEAVVEVPPYGPNDLSRLAVHFYPDQKVAVHVTTLSIRNAEYPAELKWDMPVTAYAVAGRPLPDGPKEPDFVVPRVAPEPLETAAAPLTEPQPDSILPRTAQLENRDLERKE